MNRTKYLKGECQHCGGHIEFPADNIGTVAACPHCGQETELMLAHPPEEPVVSRRVIVWTVVGVVIVVVGLGVLIGGLKHYENLLARKKRRAAEESAAAMVTPETNAPSPPPEATEQNGFGVSKVTLEMTKGSSLTYAVGTVSNTMAQQRFGVRIELDLLDDAGRKVGVARDYRQMIEPQGEWKFKGLVTERKASSAKVGVVKEEQ